MGTSLLSRFPEAAMSNSWQPIQNIRGNVHAPAASAAKERAKFTAGRLEGDNEQRNQADCD